jgi:hypothetical protein
MKFEIFERLNSGSVILNAQELRNSIYRGPFNGLLRQLVKNPLFRQLLGSKQPRRRMVDEEMVLRFLAMSQRLDRYRPPLKRFLNNYMKDLQHADQDTLIALSDMFDSTLVNVREALGASAFRLLDRSGRPTETSINRALFEAQMLCFSWLARPLADAEVTTVKREITALFQSDLFNDAIQRATGDRSRTYTRIRMTSEAISAAGADLNVPYDLTFDAIDVDAVNFS